MKIAFFTDSNLGQINGVVTSLTNTANELTALGHTVCIVTPKSKSDQENTQLDPKIDVYTISSVPGIVYPDLRLATPVSFKVLEMYRTFQPDLIHFHTIATLGMQAIFLAKLFNIPLVGTFHTYFMEPEYLRIVKLESFTALTSIGWRLTNYVYSQADAITTPSHFTKMKLIAHGIKKPISVIPNGIFPVPKKADRLHSINLPKKYLLYVGRLSPEKSVDTLISAFQKTLQILPDVTLVIVGDGPAKNTLINQAKKLKIDDHVLFLGAIPHDNLLRSPIYRNAKAFVSASTSEVQNLTSIEAMHFGLPLIGIKDTVLSEIMKNNAILCTQNNTDELASAMAQVFTDHESTDRMRKASLHLAQSFNIADATQRMISLYDSLLQSPPKSD